MCLCVYYWTPALWQASFTQIDKSSFKLVRLVKSTEGRMDVAFIKRSLIGFWRNNLPITLSFQFGSQAAQQNHSSVKTSAGSQKWKRHMPASCSTLCTNTWDHTPGEKPVAIMFQGNFSKHDCHVQCFLETLFFFFSPTLFSGLLIFKGPWALNIGTFSFITWLISFC